MNRESLVGYAPYHLLLLLYVVSNPVHDSMIDVNQNTIQGTCRFSQVGNEVLYIPIVNVDSNTDKSGFACEQESTISKGILQTWLFICMITCIHMYSSMSWNI